MKENAIGKGRHLMTDTGISNVLGHRIGGVGR